MARQSRDSKSGKNTRAAFTGDPGVTAGGRSDQPARKAKPNQQKSKQGSQAKGKRKS